MHSGIAQGARISLAVKLGLAFLAGLLAWAAGPFGLLDKDVVSEAPAWVLPGIVFGALVLVPLGIGGSPARAVAMLVTGVAAWVAAFAVGGFGWWFFGWFSVAIAGSISGVILGLVVPRLIQSPHHFRYFVVLSCVGFLGSIPFAIGLKTMDWKGTFFPPQWVIPSYIFWNMVIATALHLSAKK